MENEKYQKELFEFESPKKAAAKFSGIFPRTDLAITLTPEKMVFAAIGIIMLVVVFFALGVEKGKAAAGYAKSAGKKAAVKELAKAPVMPASPGQAPVIVVKGPVVKNATSNINPKAAEVEDRDLFDKTKPYMVVAVTFSRKDFALKEVGRLKAAGLEAFVYYGEPYYLACVGSFKNKNSAGKTLNRVRQFHKDAYVRLR